MSNIVEFLRARLDEDEALAREACDRESGEWFMGDKWNVYQQKKVTPYEYSDTEELVVYGNMKGQSEHIARHDPASVLREVKAKRELIAAYEKAVARRVMVHSAPNADDGEVQRVATVEATFYYAMLLAMHPYEEHPDYNPAWAA